MLKPICDNVLEAKKNDPCSTASITRTLADNLSRLVNICKRRSSVSSSSEEASDNPLIHAQPNAIRRHSLPVRRMSNVRKPLHLSPRKRDRGIHVQYMDSNSKDDLIDEEGGDALELPDHNFTPSLQLVDLRDGCFTARLPLNALPAGHVTIRIRNYKMEVVLNRRASMIDYHHCICRPVRLGDIDLPIYINPSTLSFEVDEDTLYVTALTKGFHGGRRVSTFCERTDTTSSSSSSSYIHTKPRKNWPLFAHRERANTS